MGGGEGEKRLMMSEKNRKSGKPTRRICVRSIVAERERERVLGEEFDGRFFLEFEAQSYAANNFGFE